jgi:hypothetical protein
MGTLEPVGVGIALMGDQRVFTDPLVGLAQFNADFLGQPHQRLATARCISLASAGMATAGWGRLGEIRGLGGALMAQP